MFLPFVHENLQIIYSVYVRNYLVIKRLVLSNTRFELVCSFRKGLYGIATNQYGFHKKYYK